MFYGALVEAVKRESHQAIKHWWGVGTTRVWLWRRAAGVEANNQGTRKLRQAYSREPGFQEFQRAARSIKQDPERRAKIAAAKRGVPRSKATIAKMRKAATGRKASAVTRTKMSIAQWRRGTRPPAAGVPWTVQEDHLCLTLKPAEVVKRTGRTLAAVYSRRINLGVSRG